jgi:hypothetical protein
MFSLPGNKLVAVLAMPDIIYLKLRKTMYNF